ncbi:MAG: hypothetical protein KC910_02065 [Candidatus Eremiobacteraeota bacterium]|nr:hypothetical protein [Candidatus Eremiobacteraeota bacterium]
MRLRLLFLSLVSTAALAAGLTTEVVEKSFPGEESLGYFGGCSLACALPWTTTASGHLPASGALAYGPDQATDVDFATCWAVAQGPGAWLEMSLGNPDEKQRAPWRAVSLVNGYAKTPELWKKNSRVKTLEVSLNGKSLGRVVLKDTASVQSIHLPDTEVGYPDKIRLTIIDTYPGTAYADTCISEVILEGAH